MRAQQLTPLEAEQLFGEPCPPDAYFRLADTDLPSRCALATKLVKISVPYPWPRLADASAISMI